MFTDLENSTKWLRTVSHESGQLLLEEYDKIVAYEVSRARGRVLKAMGDGYMCLFESPADAARCATRLQKALDLFNRTTHHGSIPSQRVALESGDLMSVERSHGNDVSGMPIARCARLLALCAGGHILMSRSFWDLAKDRFPLLEEDFVCSHGEIELRGFDRQKVVCLELLWTDSDGVRHSPMPGLGGSVSAGH
jgi:class 3 adenylate cyclase